MWEGTGVERSREGLEKIERELTSWRYLLDYTGGSPVGVEHQNMLLIALLMTKAALAREESRGCHFRRDFPGPDPRLDNRHSRFQRDGNCQ